MNTIKEKKSLTKKLVNIFIGFACFFLILSTGTAFADSSINGYYQPHLSYVQPHPRFIDGYSDDSCKDCPNDDIYMDEHKKDSISKLEKWGTLW